MSKSLVVVESPAYQVVQEHWGEFCERAEESGGLPAFVTKEVDEYLACGTLEHGVLRLACLSCGYERLVGFSCKRRGFYPSCLGRRMTDTAIHLAENVFPPQMVRQWVCCLRWRLRSLRGYDKAPCAEVLAAFTHEVQRSLRYRAKKMLGLSSMSEAHTGGVTFIQRFDSALRLNVHFHSLFLDRVSGLGDRVDRNTQFFLDSLEIIGSHVSPHDPHAALSAPLGASCEKMCSPRFANVVPVTPRPLTEQVTCSERMAVTPTDQVTCSERMAVTPTEQVTCSKLEFPRSRGQSWCVDFRSCS